MTAAPDDTTTFEGAGVEVVGCKTGKRCNLASRGLPDLRRQRKYGMAEDRTGAVEGLDQAILGREGRLACDELGHTLCEQCDIEFDTTQPLGEDALHHRLA